MLSSGLHCPFWHNGHSSSVHQSVIKFKESNRVVPCGWGSDSVESNKVGKKKYLPCKVEKNIILPRWHVANTVHRIMLVTQFYPSWWSYNVNEWKKRTSSSILHLSCKDDILHYTHTKILVSQFASCYI